MPVTGASGSKSNPGGKSGNAAGQSMGKSSNTGRGGNVNQQGSRQGRQGSLGTTKAQVNAGVLGQRINSPLSNPFSRAQAAVGSGHVHRTSAAAIAAGGIEGMVQGRKSRGDASAAGGAKAVAGRLQSHQAFENETR